MCMVTVNSTTHPLLPFTLPPLDSLRTRGGYSCRSLNFTLTVPNGKALDLFKSASSSFAPLSLQSNVVMNAQREAEQPLLGSLVLNGTDVISDVSGNVREIFDSANLFYGTENPIALAALGFTTGFNVISGGLNVKEGITEEKVAEKMADSTGKALAHLKIAKGSVQAAGGVVFIPARALTIAALATASKAYATAAGVLGGIGGVCFNIVSILSGIMLGIRLCEVYQFYRDLKKILNDSHLSEEDRQRRALEYFKQLRIVNPQEKEEIRQAIMSSEKFRSLTSEQQQAKIIKKENKLLQKKEAYLRRIVGDEGLEWICQKGPQEAKTVIDFIQRKSFEKLVMMSMGMGLILLGIGAAAIAFVPYMPAMIASAVVGLAVSLGWLILDAYTVYKDFDKGEPGRFDKLWIFLSTTLAMISVSLVFFFSTGIPSLIAASIVGAVWFAMNSACYFRIYRFEQKKLDLSTHTSVSFAAGH